MAYSFLHFCRYVHEAKSWEESGLEVEHIKMKSFCIENEKETN